MISMIFVSKTTESNMKKVDEMVAGDGGGLALPPAFVFVNPRSARRYKKNNEIVSMVVPKVRTIALQNTTQKNERGTRY